MERRGRLVLPAAGSTPAALDVEPQPKRRRAVRAGLIVAAALVLMPVVFVVPPHFLWPLVALVAGLYFARKVWVGEYVVRSFEGACPRCGEALTLEPGTRIRSRERIECYGCHREPELVVAGDADGSGADATPNAASANAASSGPGSSDPAGAS
jgi:hypothetical protein